MANIMASVDRVACAAAGLLLASTSLAQADDPPGSGYNPLSSSYSLSHDDDRWSDAYSVFRVAVAEDFGVIGGGFAASNDPRLKPLTRLDTAWNMQAPLIPVPMRVGDGVSSAALWDQPVRMGGIQIGNFQPGAPAVLPPTLLASSYAPVGPGGLLNARFIDHLRSLMQGQQSNLAPEGASEFSLESGRLRENFALRSDDYGPWLTSGTYRYGISDLTTVDGQVAQLARQQDFMGVGVTEGLGSTGLVSARVASSHQGDVNGWLAVFGADYRQNQISVTVKSTVQSPGFQPIGDAAVLEPLRQRTLASAGVDLGPLGRVSVAGAAQIYTDDSRRDILALSHSMHFGSGGIVSAAAAYSPGPLGNSAVLLSFTYPFDALGHSGRTLDSAVLDSVGLPRLPTVGRVTLDRPGQPIY
jgi:outer membrane usher protein